MKRTVLVSATLALILSASSVFAFGLPSINTGNSTMNSVVNGAVDAGKNKAIADDINKKIKAQNCQFKKNSTETTCNLNAIISSVNSKRSTLESLGLVSSMTINMTVHGPTKGDLANKRWDAAYDTLWGQLNWSHWNTPSRVKDNTDALDISVSVK